MEAQVLAKEANTVMETSTVGGSLKATKIWTRKVSCTFFCGNLLGPLPNLAATTCYFT